MSHKRWSVIRDNRIWGRWLLQKAHEQFSREHIWLRWCSQPLTDDEIWSLWVASKTS